ncbi:ABC transporter ATP-binding protein [Brevibacillus halotolerans]|uniref:ABC transporter ATP-binding protein n=1 Tax=Brevibacillus TaxID=55080 RepID=UPI00215B7FE0|nr:MULTISPECIES: ABC transporter ATP-binding protein [Brevibacillus]MCR8965134.1 ABC transporter ATP-binding protein [Brevibacillus laterosporus]MCZ0837289.1 ABC transporter ATP-binding protein [Brevibacillus halotolerans]
MTQKILHIENLETHFFSDRGRVPAVDRVNLSINKGEVLGIVGESGCGKSVTSLSVMRLVPNPPGKIVGGNILFKGENLLTASEKRMREIRGNEIAMIFQEPMTSLNPVYKIGDQIREAVILHKKVSKKEATKRAIEMLHCVGIPRAEEIIHEYPHQLSGGMRQRVMIAMAMACSPQLLIADEPTTALDVTIQAQILDLMRSLNEDMGTAIMLITHDLGVVAEMCHRVVVMYSGNVVEEGDVTNILKNPKHPYTQGLLQSIPHLEEKKERLYSIPGNVPLPGTIKEGCRFAPRCEYVTDKCRMTMPQLLEVGTEHRARCFLHEQ